ncbi:MAG: leucine-rich repeat domain-containing protein [Bacteroidales bacterium]|nr:leucine-rich repeat domain-containing protein [Bacteroidales bacterium]
MKKILIATILSLMALGPLGSLRAQDSVFSYTHQGTTLYYIVDSNAEAIVVPPLYPNFHQVSYNNYSTWYGYTQPTGNVVIPDTVPCNGVSYPVKSVGWYAFYNCSAVTGVTLPDGIECMDIGAFMFCTSLQSITLPTALREIRYSAFTNCSALTAISIPENVELIDSAAFAMCSQLQTVTLPDGLQTIKWATFSECCNLQNINFPNSLTTIEDNAFSNDIMLGPTIELPNGLTHIGAESFSNCSGLINVALPGSLNSINVGAFYSCTHLQSVTLAEGLISIQEQAFSNCSSLRHINLPQTLTYIEPWTFYGCTAIDTLIIPNNVIALGSATLALCSSLKHCHLPERLTRVEGWLLYGTALKELVVPDNVTYIEDQAFAGCTQLHKVTLSASLSTISDSLFIDGTPLDTLILRSQEPPMVPANAFPSFNVTLIVPCGTEQAYRQHSVWGQFTTIVENCNAIDETENHNLKVYNHDGHIVVEGADGEKVHIYDMSGRKVVNRMLSAGAYIVKVGDRMTKCLIY